MITLARLLVVTIKVKGSQLVVQVVRNILLFYLQKWPLFGAIFVCNNKMLVIKMAGTNQ
jgi:hypothetical protein